MRHRATVCQRALTFILAIFILIFTSSRLRADIGECPTGSGNNLTLPFTDLPASNQFFCSIAEAFFSGLSNGTTATTYSPGDPVPREQMAAFVTRTLDQSLKRGSRRAALNQYWTPTSNARLALTTVGSSPLLVESDGADLWVANFGNGTVSRVRASDGKLRETWTGAAGAVGVLAANGRIFVSGFANPGKLYQIDPALPMGAVTTVSSSLGIDPEGISFDGQRIWTADSGISGSLSGSVSIVTLNPLNVVTVTTGFSHPVGILYDGANMWVTDQGNGTSAGNLFKLDSDGAIIQTVATRILPRHPVFDGTNIWVPNANSNSITVVRASTGAILATLSGNGLNDPEMAAFDGERILVNNNFGKSVSLWKATDLTPLSSVSTGSAFTVGACSDGLNFWITLSTGKLLRF